MSKKYISKRYAYGRRAYRVPNDVNGNPRYIIHYVDIPYRAWEYPEDTESYHTAWFEHALTALGGNRYRGLWATDCIVFTSYNLKDTIKKALT